MTKQEILFLSRIAEYLVGIEINDKTMADAALQVLADDRRLVAKLLDDGELKAKARRHLSDSTYKLARA